MSRFSGATVSLPGIGMSTRGALSATRRIGSRRVSPASSAPAAVTSESRYTPELRGVKLPEKFGVPGAQGVIVTKGGVIFAGGGDTAFHAIDTIHGHDLWTFPLPRATTATPMTYRAKNGKQYVAITASGGLGITDPSPANNEQIYVFALP